MYVSAPADATSLPYAVAALGAPEMRHGALKPERRFGMAPGFFPERMKLDRVSQLHENLANITQKLRACAST